MFISGSLRKIYGCLRNVILSKFVICHGVKMGLHFSDPWDKPKDMLKADELLENTGEES